MLGYVNIKNYIILTMYSDVILDLEGAGSLASLETGVGLHLGGVAYIHIIHLQYPIAGLQDPLSKVRDSLLR